MNNWGFGFLRFWSKTEVSIPVRKTVSTLLNSCCCCLAYRNVMSQSEVGVKNRKFSDLAHLIQQYAQRGEKNGLACSLLHPVNVEPDEDEIGR